MITFEFNQQLMPQSLIDIEQVGQFAIEAHNEGGYYWYLIIRTSLGTTTVVSCGPKIPDVSLLPSGYTCSLNKMQFNEKKLEKLISMWLNDKMKALIEAKVIEIDDVIDQIVELKDYLKNYSEEIY